MITFCFDYYLLEREMEITCKKKKRDLSPHLLAIIERVIKLCDQEAEINIPLHSLKKARLRACYYANICRRTAEKLTREARSEGDTIGNKKKRISGSRFIDSLDTMTISHCIRDYYKEHSGHVVTENLLPVVKSKIFFPWGRATLYRILWGLGYRNKRPKHRSDNTIKKGLWIEKVEFVDARSRYLQEMEQLRRDGRKVFYLNETWLGTSLTRFKYGQINSSWGTFLKKTILIVNITSEVRLTTEDHLILSGDEVPKRDRAFVHLKRIHEWLAGSVIPNLPQNSVIVIDEEAYYAVEANKPPDKYATKAAMFKWLSKNSIPCTMDMNKFELYDLIITNSPSEKCYTIEKVFVSKGHQIVRFPPNVWDLNPFEWVFTKMIQMIKERSGGKVMSRVELTGFTSEVLQEMQAEELASFSECVLRLEEDYWRRDGQVEDLVDSILLRRGVELEDTTGVSNFENIPKYRD